MAGALGFIELPHLCDAIDALDVMLKAAAVKFETWEKKLGGRLVTVIISGTVGSVTAAVEAACAHADVKASLVLAAPHAETMKMVARSAQNVKVV